MAAGRVRAWLLASSALVVAGAAPIPGLAANTTWTNGNATDVWSDNANWDTNAKPTGADDALITSVGTAGAAVTVNTDEAANSVTVSNGNQVDISAGSTLSAGTITINGGSTIQVGGSLSGATTNAGTLNIGIGSTGGVLTGDVNNTGTLLFNRSDASAYSGIISGSGTVTKQGAGTLTLSGLSTYTGGSTISAGTVDLSQLTFFNPGPLSSGLGLGAIALDGGKLLTSTTGSLANDLTFNANKTSILAAAAGTTLTLGGDPNISGNTATALTFGANAVAQFGSATDTGTIRIGASSNSPTIDSSSSVVVAGGKLQDFQDALWHVLSGVNTYAGPTNVTAGTLSSGAAGAFSPNSAFNVGALGTLDLSGFSQTIGSLAGSGPVVLGTAILTTGNDNTGTTYSGAIQGAGGRDQDWLR